MKIIETFIEGLTIIKPTLIKDNRGFFYESHNKKILDKVTNINFVQDNVSISKQGVIRGLHFQIPPFDQTKLVGCLSGNILDVVLDLRKKSKTFGKTFKIILSNKNNMSLFIPRGFGHAYYSYEKENIIYYKLDNFYKPEYEDGINALDKNIKIKWPTKKFLISKKDKKLGSLKNFITEYKYL